jgi:hypothetical protein
VEGLGQQSQGVENRMAPPIPWALRDRISIIGDWARPQSREPAVKTMSPMVKSSLRP